jgi:hypothetical protein
MRLRYELPMVAAEKTEKMTAIDMVNCDFIDNRLFIHESLRNVHMQYEALTWDDKHKEDPLLPNDYADSILYAHRFCRHYWGKIQPKISHEQKLEMQILDFAEKPTTRNWVDEL